MSVALELRDVSKSYDRAGPKAVDSVSLTVEEGEVLALLGPSGCGKTTLLRLVAGFERPDAGMVVLGGKIVAGWDRFVPPEQRAVGMVFQEHALFPHLTVEKNVAFGLTGRKKRTARERVDEMLGLVGLEGLCSRYPHELSGGERQRVALARALAPRPLVALLDEPFSSLDADLRASMREEVKRILTEIGATAIFVTHDQEEAMFMGDKLAVLRGGRLEQVGPPAVVFREPATRFVADFLGGTDFLVGTVMPTGVATELGLVATAPGFALGSRVEVAIRADDVRFVAEGEPGFSLSAGVVARVVDRHFHRLYVLYHLRLPSGSVVHALRLGNEMISPGAEVRAWIPLGRKLPVFPLSVGADETPRLTGDPASHNPSSALVEPSGAPSARLALRRPV